MTNTLFIYDGDSITKNIAKIMASVLSMSKYAAYTEEIQIARYQQVVFVVGAKRSMCADFEKFASLVTDKWTALIVADFQNTHMEERCQQVAAALGRKLDFTAFVSQEQYVDDAIKAVSALYAAAAPAGENDPDVLHAIEEFLQKHNTGVLATGWGRYVRATPLEYVYKDGHLYIFSEGGGKFANLYRNDQVSFSVCDPFSDFQHLAGLQLHGTARIIEPDDPEYADLAAIRKIPVKRLLAMPVILHIIDITLANAVFLWGGFTKLKKAPRQTYRF